MLLLVGAVLLPLPAHARYYSGATLLAECRSSADFEIGRCLGYVTGVVDILIGLHYICPPEQIMVKGMVNTVVQELEALPELQNYDASEIVAPALVKNFPCKKKR